jgi:hypothetical protein
LPQVSKYAHIDKLAKFSQLFMSLCRSIEMSRDLQQDRFNIARQSVSSFLRRIVQYMCRTGDGNEMARFACKMQKERMYMHLCANLFARLNCATTDSVAQKDARITVERDCDRGQLQNEFALFNLKKTLFSPFCSAPPKFTEALSAENAVMFSNLR